MNNDEVSQTISIGVVLVLLGAFISLVLITLSIGLEVKGAYYNKASSLSSQMKEGYLDDLVGKENKMPTAAAYSILRIYGNLVPEFECRCEHRDGSSKKLDLTEKTPCLLDHMGGEVSLEVIKENTWYKIIVHKGDCVWYYDECTCK